MGGAIYNSASKLTITDAVFADNETSGGSASGGGAIYNDGTNYGSGILEISNSTFINNKSVHGGAIENSAHLTLENVSFVGNLVNFENEPGYARGGALWNYADATITNGSFINNSAAGDGGAIYNDHVAISFSGNTVFEGNTAGGQLNDIYNLGTINVAGNMSLDGGLTGYSAMSPGKITFANGSSLNVKAGTTTFVNNAVKNEGATLVLTIDNGFSGDYALISSGSTLDNEFTLADNNLYNISTTDTKGTYAISKKSGAEIANKIGASSNDVAAILAITDGDSANPSFNKIADNINEMLQSGDASQVQAALDGVTAMSPDSAPTVQQTQSETTHQVFNAIGTRLSDGVSGNSRGMSSGDASENVSVWMQGLANHTKLDKTSKSYGFKADTYGVALGLEKKINSSVKAGIGYAYSSTDADTKGRDTEVKTQYLQNFLLNKQSLISIYL